jgi:hypothetical protein
MTGDRRQQASAVTDDRRRQASAMTGDRRWRAPVVRAISADGDDP